VTAWCEFHNGAAAGLKIAPYRGHRHPHRQQQQQQGQQPPEADVGSGMASSRGSSRADSLSESWLPHSKPTVPNYAHAGVLLALGLNGHLNRLSWTDLYRCGKTHRCCLLECVGFLSVECGFKNGCCAVCIYD
jgi:hypothetical protein